MESVFLACFLFGALFTVASTVLGAVGHGTGHDAGAGHGHAHFGDAHGHLPHVAGAHNGTPAVAAHDAPGADVQHASTGFAFPPLLNLSSLVAFLTWFGAAGYILLHFAGWSLPAAFAVAVLAGLAGAVLIALFLGQVLAGEQVLDARQYRLPGTLARVTVSIPAAGTGEIVFAKGGGRRSEAARSRTGRPIARNTEVVILEYGKGVAAVQPFQELLEEKEATDGHGLPAAASGGEPAAAQSPPAPGSDGDGDPAASDERSRRAGV